MDTALGESERNPKEIYLFFKLPKEIRLMIYGELLVQKHSVEWMLNEANHKSRKSDSKSGGTPSIIHSAIMSTCRLIYEETLPILYASNVFKITNFGISAVYDVHFDYNSYSGLFSRIYPSQVLTRLSSSAKDYIRNVVYMTSWYHCGRT